MFNKLSLVLLAVLSVAAGGGEQQYQSAVAAVQAGNLEAALDHFEDSLRAEPDSLKFGSEYRQAVIKLKAYDRCISFFEKLVSDSPNAGNAYLNYGFAYVDKIPDAGAITQVINANTALSFFTKSIEIESTWIGYYTRGNSYLFWPKIFNRTQLGIDDLLEAMKIQDAGPQKTFHVRAYLALGDGYWKLEDTAKAREVWKKGLSKFPGHVGLKKRVEAEEAELESIVKTSYDPNVRVDTNLIEVWTEQ